MADQNNILEHLSTAVVALDGELRITSINTSGEVLLEASASRLLGLHAGQMVVGSAALLDTLEQARQLRTALVHRGMAITLSSGSEIQVDLIATPVLDESGAVGLLLEILAVDRLLRISREEGLLQARESSHAMIRGLAHEIKNPLGGIRGAAQLLAKELPTTELAEYTGIIILEADRLRNLVDRLLGPTHQLTVRDLNIHEILEHVRNLISAEAGNRLQVIRDYDPSIPEIPADRSQLIQAILNIARNALQAAPAPEQCQLTLRSRSQRQFNIGAQRHRLVCRVDIIDNGPGIPADLLPSIFVPMISGRAGGTGLGLAIAQSIVNQHGGLLECESCPGETRFSLYLPLEEVADATSR